MKKNRKPSDIFNLTGKVHIPKRSNLVDSSYESSEAFRDNKAVDASKFDPRKHPGRYWPSKKPKI